MSRTAVLYWTKYRGTETVALLCAGYFRSAVESIGSYVELNAGGAHIQRLEGAGAESVPAAEVPLSTAAEELVEGDSGKETQQIVEDSERGVANENDPENGETDDAAAVEVKRKKG